ncbi:MAG: MgtC/SapB family protein [Anaerolineales bacterium]
MQLPINYAEQLSILAQLVVAMVLGGMIGLDREVAEKPAGLRTHILVAGASALLVSLGELVVKQLTGELGTVVIRGDPIRIIAAIITGVSFLGAGTIIRQRSNGGVKGLTTAASLLFVSVIGITVSLSEWFVAIAATILVLVILRLIPTLERFFTREQN